MEKESFAPQMADLEEVTAGPVKAVIGTKADILRREVAGRRDARRAGRETFGGATVGEARDRNTDALRESEDGGGVWKFERRRPGQEEGEDRRLEGFRRVTTGCWRTV